MRNLVSAVFMCQATTAQTALRQCSYCCACFLPAWHFHWSCFTLAEVAHEKFCICSAHIHSSAETTLAVLVPDDSMESLVSKQGDWLRRKQTEVRARECWAALLPPPCDRAALLPGPGSCPCSLPPFLGHCLQPAGPLPCGTVGSSFSRVGAVL